jgi:hypothetical protein
MSSPHRNVNRRVVRAVAQVAALAGIIAAGAGLSRADETQPIRATSATASAAEAEAPTDASAAGAIERVSALRVRSTGGPNCKR